MAKLIAVNGSPRKNWNTAILLKESIKGASDNGAQTELVHLYDLDYKGCRSCFTCKLKDNRVRHCVINDGLLPLLKSITEADAVLLGSPFYFWDVTGAMRGFLERLLFPYMSYSHEPYSFENTVNSAFIYTMGVTKQIFEKESDRYKKKIDDNAELLTKLFGSSDTLVVHDTYQFDDYSRYATDMFDPEQKLQQRIAGFPIDLRRAYELGAKLIAGCES